MTPRQAEEWLGLKPSSRGRSLLQIALRREEELGRKFLIRNGRTRSGMRYRFTREMIRLHLRDLWQNKFDRLATRAAETVRRIEQHIDKRIDERIDNHPTVLRIAEESAETIGLVESLSKQIDRLIGPPASARKSLTKGN